MPATIVNIESPDAYGGITAAAAALRAGGLVIFPTETVYGVAANATDPRAVERLRKLKGQRGDQPFTVHLGDRGDAAEFVPQPPPMAARLARRTWPGPLTIVCEVADPGSTPVATRFPDPAWLADVFHRGKVGLRCPDHPVATALLRAAGVPVIASSANRSAQPPPGNLGDALRDLADEVEYALDAGPTQSDSASTVIEVRGNGFQVLRAGRLDERTLRRLAVAEVLMVCTGNTCRSPLAEHLFRAELARQIGVAPDELATAGYVISSAGTSAGGGAPMSAGSVVELQRRGIEGGRHRSQPLTAELVQRAARVYTMTGEHRAAVLDWVPAAAGRVELLDPGGAVSDPIGGGPEDYRRCADQIENAVRIRVKEFLHEDRDWK